MASELLRQLVMVNLALCAAILVAISLRGLVRRRFGARMAYGLWLAAPLGVLAVFAPKPEGLLPSAEPVRMAASQTVAAALDVVAAPAAAPAAISFLEALLFVWLAGFVVAAVLTLVAHSRGMASFGGLAASGRRGILRASKTGLGPAMVGILRPRLVLPVDFETRFTAREQTLILAHEDHHRASGDTRINGLVSLVCCLNWFNPLVHVAAYLLRVDQELACDAAVVERFPGERRTYAEALLKSQLVSAPLPLGCTWPSGSPKVLQERLTMLAFKTPGRCRLIAGSALVGALCLGTAAAAWAASGAPADASKLIVDAVTVAPAQRVIVGSAPTTRAVPTASTKTPSATNYAVDAAQRSAPVAAVTIAAAEPAAETGYTCLSNSCARTTTATSDQGSNSIYIQAPAAGRGANSISIQTPPPPPPPPLPPPPPPPGFQGNIEVVPSVGPATLDIRTAPDGKVTYVYNLPDDLYDAYQAGKADAAAGRLSLGVRFAPGRGFVKQPD